VVVTVASGQDRDGAIAQLARLRHRCSRLRVIWADQASIGALVTWLWALRPWRTVRLQMVKRPEGAKGFLLLPKRWIVARTCAWLGRYRRLSKAYDY
jgi:putative transposase